MQKIVCTDVRASERRFPSINTQFRKIAFVRVEPMCATTEAVLHIFLGTFLRAHVFMCFH